MTEVLPFECEHEAECHESGWDYSKDCPERCTLRKEKRVKELEQVASEMDDMLDKLHMECKILDRRNARCHELKAERGTRVRELHERLKGLVMSVDA